MKVKPEIVITIVSSNYPYDIDEILEKRGVLLYEHIGAWTDGDIVKVKVGTFKDWIRKQKS